MEPSRHPTDSPRSRFDAGARWETELERIRIVYGAGELTRLGELVRDLGCGRALVVSDSGVREAGHVDSAIGSLREAGVAGSVYDGVEENPTTRHVGEGFELARLNRVDVLVGLGGGSAMDCAKGINFLLTNGGRMEDYQGRGKALRPMLPSIGVPTTAGTGSEAQSFALIAREEDHVKMACGDAKARFACVVLDPSLPVTAPRRVVAASGLDAVAHTVESFVSLGGNPVSQMLSREAWRLLDLGLSTVLGGSRDERAWGRMLVGSHFAGAAIERSMLGAAHACANPLTSGFGVTHGFAVSVMLPHVVRFNASHVGDRYDELRRASGKSRPVGLLEERLVELRRLAGGPDSLCDLSIPRERLPSLAAEAEQQWTARFNPRPVDRGALLQLYEAAYE